MDDDASSRPDGGGAELAESQWAGFTAVWAAGYRRIFVIRLVRRGAPAHMRVTTSPTMLFRWLVLSFGPSVVSVASLTVLPEGDLFSRARQAGLLLLLGLINAGMFAAAIMAWSYALRNANTIDDLLRPCETRDWVVSIIGTATQTRWQVVLPLIFVSVPYVDVVTGSNSATWWSPTAVLLLVNVTWTMLLLGNVSYWLIIPPWLVVRMRSCADLVLRWHDPARTPGIRTFAQGYAYTAVFLALGAVGVTIPRALNYDLFERARLYPYIWLLVLSLWTGVFTQGIIYSVIRRFRLRTLDQLSAPRDFMLAEHQTARLSAIIEKNPDMLTTMSTYNVVAAAPSLPYGTAVVVQYLTAIVGSVVGVLLH